MRFKTIKSKLLFSFFVFLLITCLIVLANIWFNLRKDKSQQILFTLSLINQKTETVRKVELLFLIDEAGDVAFYQNKSSEYLSERTQNIQEIKESLQFLRQQEQLRYSQAKIQIDSLFVLFGQYEVKFKEFVELIKRRGFKDYGLEGEMREDIHNVENAIANNRLDLAKLLTVRRNEKDFLLRKENKYIQQTLRAIYDLQADIKQKIPNTALKDSLNKLLTRYKETFLKLVQTEQHIGFTNRIGIRGKLIDITNQIQSKIAKLNDSIYDDLNAQTQQRIVASSVTILFCVGLIVFLTFYITNILSKPILQLSDSIHQVIKSNFSKASIIEKIESGDEIGRLSEDFSFMLQKMQESFSEIQTKSQKIEEKQRLLMESIQYAKKIQESILPEIEDFEKNFQDYFILYQPLHVVSGDFYWMTKIQDRLFVAVVDCTGHGVPGAFMSMIGNTLLNKIVKEQDIHLPNLILETLDYEIKIALNQELGKNNDGMDVSLCLIEQRGEKQYVVTFSGAKGKLFYAQDGLIHKIKGTRRSIGGNISEKNDKSIPFENYEIVLDKGEVMYMGSDGFCDQPSPTRKKYGTKRFIKFLENHYTLSLDEQKTLLLADLAEHNTDEHAQRDDITLIGLKM